MKKQSKTVPADMNMVIRHKWRDLGIEEAINWHKANRGDKFTKAEQVAYSSGYAQAWMIVISALQLHGFLTMKETCTNIYTGEKTERIDRPLS